MTITLIPGVVAVIRVCGKYKPVEQFTPGTSHVCSVCRYDQTIGSADWGEKEP